MTKRVLSFFQFQFFFFFFQIKFTGRDMACREGFEGRE